MAPHSSATNPWTTAMILCLVLAGFAAESQAQYAAPIVYKQTISQILVRTDVLGWPTGYENDLNRDFNRVVASADGTTVFFEVCKNWDAAECRLFVVDHDDSGLKDVSAIFTSDLVNSTWSWGNMVINDDGSEVFIQASMTDGMTYIRTFDTTTDATGTAVSQVWPTGYFDWFTANSDASRLYTGEFDWGYNPSLDRIVRGLSYADRNGPALKHEDIYTLPCDTLCNHLNAMYFMGTSAQGDHAFFSWTSEFVANAHPDNKNAMWHTTGEGTAHKLTTDDHYWVDGGNWRGVATADGSEAVYQYQHTTADPKEVHVVTVATGAERFVTSTTSLNPLHTFITRDGHYLFAVGDNGEWGFHYNTFYDLQESGVRDSWSYHIPWSRDYSNVTADNRYYFVTMSEDGGRSIDAGLYRVDTKAQLGGDFTEAPNVTSITFTEPYLWHDDSAQIGIAVQVSDAQSLATVASVRLEVLVEGFEQPDIYMPRKPLAFPTGDFGWTYLYDDGITAGDVTAGDGIYTHNAIATRKGNYDDWNTWYSTFTLPHQVGIRIIVQDTDGNFTTADTNLWITALDELPALFRDGFETGDMTLWSASVP